MSTVHTTLDVIGMIPGFDAADLINAGIYLLEGDYINAGISLAAVVPVLGVAATAGKTVNKAEKAFKAIERNGVEVYEGMFVTSSEALEMADKFLGKGYIEKGAGRNPNFGRFISADGHDQVRMGDADILGLHPQNYPAPHFNFEQLKPKYLDIHVYLSK